MTAPSSSGRTRYLMPASISGRLGETALQRLDQLTIGQGLEHLVALLSGQAEHLVVFCQCQGSMLKKGLEREALSEIRVSSVEKSGRSILPIRTCPSPLWKSATATHWKRASRKVPSEAR